MKLKEIREDKNYTQVEVAKMLKVSRSVYGMWEQENDIIPIKRLIDFCNLFNVSVDYVLDLTDKIKYIDMKKDIKLELI